MRCLWVKAGWTAGHVVGMNGQVVEYYKAL
jgi:hypothetical protein